MSLFRSAFTVGSLTLCSRILGYIRDMLIAFFLGAGAVSDAFFVAFRLPNTFRQLSAEGAFNNAFVPMFSGKLSTQGKEPAIRFAEQVVTFMFLVLLALTIVMEIAMPWVMRLLAPGFIGQQEKFDAAVLFARIMFPYLIFISLVALYGGILNSFGKFFAFAAAPILLNLCLILSLLFFARVSSTPAIPLAWGEVISGLVQLVWMMLIARKYDIGLKWRKLEIGSDVKSLLRRMVPGIIGGGVTQLNLWIGTLIATLIPGAVSYLYYADRVVQFPMAIVGTAMGTVLLPLLSKHSENKNLEAAIQAQNRGLEITLLLTLPAVVGLLVVAKALIVLTFQHGHFSAEDATATTKVLMAYSIGLPAFVMVKVFAPAFFAHGDTRTPVKIAVACMIANVVVSLALLPMLGYVGLAIATSVASWLNTFLLAKILIRRGLYAVDMQLFKRLPRMLVALLLMGVVLVVAQQGIQATLGQGLLRHVIELVIEVALGMGVFLGSILLVRVYSLQELKTLMRQ